MSPKDQMTYLYVTDYTRRDDLAPVAPTVPRAGELQNRVVKITLHDDQVETAKQLEAGDFVAIRNLRLRPTGAEQKLTGRLGGSQRLLSKLQPNSPNNHELKALLMRKEEFESKKNATHTGTGSLDRGRRKKKSDQQPERSTPQGNGAAAPSRKSALSADVTSPYNVVAELIGVKAVKASAICPNKFHVRARIVDFFPPKVSNFTMRTCTRCKDEISFSQRVCPICDDAMDPDNTTSVRTCWYFALEVQDDEEERLQIFSCDDKCLILKGLDPEDLDYDDSIVRELAGRLEPLCGDLLEVREGVAQRRMQESPSESPWLSMVLGSYTPGDGADPSARQYVLLDCTVAA